MSLSSFFKFWESPYFGDWKYVQGKSSVYLCPGEGTVHYLPQSTASSKMVKKGNYFENKDYQMFHYSYSSVEKWK